MVVTACGKGAEKLAVGTPTAGTSSDFTGDPNGAYCRAALQWAVVEMTPRNEDSPAAEKKYWDEYSAFLKHGEDIAPTPISSAFHAYANRGLTLEIPILRKYGFDKKRFEAQATAAEKQRIGGDPSPDEQKAFSQVTSYEWQVCGNGTPDNATTAKFTGAKDGPYCLAEKEATNAFQKVGESNFDPAAVKAFFTGSTFTDFVARSESIAPEAIKSDVAANVKWIRTKQLPVFAKYGYDPRRIALEGTPEERFASNTSAPAIRNVERRLNAYGQQVCGL